MRETSKLLEHVNFSIAKVLPFGSEKVFCPCVTCAPRYCLLGLSVFCPCVTCAQVKHFLVTFVHTSEREYFGNGIQEGFLLLRNLRGDMTFFTLLALLNTSLGWGGMYVLSLGSLQRITQCLRRVFLIAQCLLFYLVMNMGPLWLKDESTKLFSFFGFILEVGVF